MNISKRAWHIIVVVIASVLMFAELMIVIIFVEPMQGQTMAIIYQIAGIIITILFVDYIDDYVKNRTNLIKK